MLQLLVAVTTVAVPTSVDASPFLAWILGTIILWLLVLFTFLEGERMGRDVTLLIVRRLVDGVEVVVVSLVVTLCAVATASLVQA